MTDDYTVYPRSSDRFYIVIYYINGHYFWTYSSLSIKHPLNLMQQIFSQKHRENRLTKTVFNLWFPCGFFHFDFDNFSGGGGLLC